MYERSLKKQELKCFNHHGEISRSNLQEINDDELIKSFRKGNENAFSQIVLCYQKRLLQVAIAVLGDEDEAIAQWKTSYLDKFLSETTSGAVPVIYSDQDARLAETFGIPDGYEFHDEVVHYPALIIIDPEGNEVFRYVGESNRDRITFDQFTATIADLKAGGDGNSGLALEEEVTPPAGHESHGQHMGGGAGH